MDIAYVCRLRSGLIDDTKVILNCNDTASEVIRCNNVNNEVMTVIMRCNEAASEGTVVILKCNEFAIEGSGVITRSKNSST